MKAIEKHFRKSSNDILPLTSTSGSPATILVSKKLKIFILNLTIAFFLFRCTRSAVQYLADHAPYDAITTNPLSPYDTVTTALEESVETAPALALPPHRVAVMDSSNPGDHDEVILPLVWNLMALTPAHIDLYRNEFRPGSKETLQDWSRSTNSNYTFQPAASFWTQNFTNVELIVLTTGDADAGGLLHSGIMLAYSHVKVITVAHTVQFFTRSYPQWRPSPERDFQEIAYHAESGRWTFLTLSQHVARSMQKQFSTLPGRDNKVFPMPETFVPIRPIERSKYPADVRNKQFAASILGSVNPGRRDYYRILNTLSDARSKYPEVWPSIREAELDPYGLYSKRILGFRLLILGKATNQASWKGIPQDLRDLVEQNSAVLNESAFYEQLGATDIVIPGFKDQIHYTRDAASGAIPAALMARVPVLVDDTELAAYSYLKPPAYILRESAESEIEAIARLRKARQAEPIDRLSAKATELAWESYEEEIYENNQAMLLRVMRRTSLPIRALHIRDI